MHRHTSSIASARSGLCGGPCFRVLASYCRTTVKSKCPGRRRSGLHLCVFRWFIRARPCERLCLIHAGSAGRWRGGRNRLQTANAGLPQHVSDLREDEATTLGVQPGRMVGTRKAFATTPEPSDERTGAEVKDSDAPSPRANDKIPIVASMTTRPTEKKVPKSQRSCV